MPAPRPAAVVFDNDGLLLDTEEAWTRGEETLFALRGQTFTIDHKRAIIGSSGAVASGLLGDWLDEPGEALLDELHLLVMEEALQPVAARPGAIELLEGLVEAGVPVGLASNSPRDFVDRVLASSPVDVSLFGGVVLTKDDVEHPKPAPDLYLEACRRLGAAPTESVALEDSGPGTAAARAAGCFVIGVQYLPGTELPDASMLAASLGDAEVRARCGLA